MLEQNFGKMRTQRGMSTLVIVILLLFVATMVTLYTANSTIREQQVSANQYRSDQALSAANAGLDYAYANYTKNLQPFDSDGDGGTDTLTVPFQELTVSGIPDPNDSSGTGTYTHTVSARVTFVDGDSSVDRNGDGDSTNDVLDRPHTLVSTGFSDDNSATRTIEIKVNAEGIIPGGGHPGFPLIARGFAATTGNFKIINRYSNATIWTGSDASTIGSAETYIQDPLNPPGDHDEYVQYDKTGGADPDLTLHASYSQGGINSDVIEADDNLANMTGDQFFLSFIKEDKPTIRAFAEDVGQRYDLDDYSTGGQLWAQLIADDVRGVVWVDVPTGDTWAPGGNLDTIGTEQYPVSLFVNGNFDTTGTAGHDLEVIGLVYVIGDWESGGNFEVQGGVMAEGTVDLNGGPTIVFDDNLYDGSLGVPPGGHASVLAGTWKDW